MCLVAIALLLSGCTDVAAVRSIAGQLGGAARSWDEVSGELQDSCRRTQQFNALASRCEDQAAAADAIRATDTILANYFDALAAAADGQSLSIEPGIEALGQSVANVPGINGAQVQAATQLAGMLARLATMAMRERLLRDLIGRGGPAARQLVAALRQAVPRAVETSLAAEQDRIGARFAIWVAQGGSQLEAEPAATCAGGPRANRFTGAAFLLATEYCRRVQAIAARRVALDRYVASLDQADQALADLEAGRARLKGKALARQLILTGRDLDRSVRAVHAAFGPGGGG